MADLRIDACGSYGDNEKKVNANRKQENVNPSIFTQGDILQSLSSVQTGHEESINTLSKIEKVVYLNSINTLITELEKIKNPNSDVQNIKQELTSALENSDMSKLKQTVEKLKTINIKFNWDMYNAVNALDGFVQ